MIGLRTEKNGREDFPTVFVIFLFSTLSLARLNTVTLFSFGFFLF